VSHTSEKWEIVDDMIVEDSEGVVAFATTPDLARLIAMAPELVKAAITVDEVFYIKPGLTAEEQGALNRLMAIVARATGFTR
jgi:hypothetical protein